MSCHISGKNGVVIQVVYLSSVLYTIKIYMDSVKLIRTCHVHPALNILFYRRFSDSWLYHSSHLKLLIDCRWLDLRSDSLFLSEPVYIAAAQISFFP